MVKIFDIFSAGVKKYGEEISQNSKDRKKRDEGATEEFGVPIVHASELGGCPIRLARKLAGDLPDNSRISRMLFLRDGFTHEDATSELIESVATSYDVTVERDLRVGGPLLKGKAHLLGACDIALRSKQTGDDGIIAVYEHKAVNKDNFEMYKADNYALPNEYLVQCAAYVVLLDADEGLIVVKNRATSELYPDPFGEVTIGHHFYMDRKRAIDLLYNAEVILQRAYDGEYDESMALTYASRNCSWCENKKNCYPKNPEEDETSATGTIDEPDKTLLNSLINLFSIKGLADKYLAGYKDAKEIMMATLIRNNARKVTSHVGSVSLIRRKGSVYPVKSEIKRLIADGTLETYESSGYSYIGVYPKGDSGGKKDDK